MMTDFKIRRGLSSQLFSAPGVINPDLIIEDGCWYLCTDTAELFLGVAIDAFCTLKRINSLAATKLSELVNDCGFITKIPDNYVVEDDLLAFYSKAEVDTNIKKAIEEASFEQSEVDLSDYAKKADIPDVSKFITEVPAEYITETELAEKGYLTAHQDLSSYVKAQYVDRAVIKQKYEVLPVDGMLVSYNENEIRLNTQRVVPEKQTVGATGNPNMFYVTFRAYAPEGATGVIESDGTQTDPSPTPLQVDELGRKYTVIWSAIASYNGATWTKWGDSSTIDKYLGFYYTFKWYKDTILIGEDKVRVILTNDACHTDLVPDAIARRIDDKIKAIEIPKYDLSEYAKKTDIPSVTGLATEQYVNEKIESITIPEVDLTDYAKLSDLPSIEGLATEAYVKNAIAEAELNDKDVDLSDYATKSYVTDAINNIELPSIDTAELATKVELAEVAAKIPAVDGLATETYVNAKIDNIVIPEVPTKVSELVNDVGYLTEHQDLSDYAKRNELPSIAGLATEQFVQEQLSNIKIPDTDLSDYFTKAEALEAIEEAVAAVDIPVPDLSSYYTVNETNAAITTAVGGKANKVPFTTDLYVTKPVGNFVVGDNLNGLTITEILAKLLELTNSAGSDPDDPDLPVEPNGLIETILAEQSTMYAVTVTGALVEIPFNLNIISAENADEPCTESGFYVIKDSTGAVIEAGYQEIQIKSSDLYYVIALPKAVDYESMVTIKAYDNRQKCWADAEKFNMVSDPTLVTKLCDEVGIDISHIDQNAYTILVLEDLPSGSLLRYVINE